MYRFFGMAFLLVVGLTFILFPTNVVAQEISKVEPKIKVLIVTGVDYPGHSWRTQALELRKALGGSKLIDIRLVEDIEVLGTSLIFDYDVLMLNFKNYEPLKREETAKRNLLRFITDGSGLMLFHFTGGAFENWSGYEQVAGRIWNPSFRGHDPFQEFTVNVVKKDHPIMLGMKDFKITDELYTCLDGKRDIEIIAEATSAIDGKKYPMAFCFTEGKGRGFHTVLGHNEKAFEAPELTVMLQRAAIWCAGKEEILTTESQQMVTAANVLEARINVLTKSLLGSGKLVSYLECGSDDKYEQGVSITPAVDTKMYRFESNSLYVMPAQETVLFAPESVSFLIKGLDRSKKYRAHLVWWDADANGRVQSVLAKTTDETLVKMVRPAKSLPDYKVNQLLPETVVMLLPMAYVRDGEILLAVKNDGGPNAVASEIWIEEITPEQIGE